MNKIKLDNKAFTLVEFLIYISIMTFVLLGIVYFILIAVRAREKGNLIAEVEIQGHQVLQTITQTIRNAEDIISPTIGTSADSLSINVYDIAKDPTNFNLVNNSLIVSEAGGSEINLTTDKVVLTNLDFKNVSRNNTRDTIKIQFDLSYNNIDNNSTFEYSKTFYGSATRK